MDVYPLFIVVPIVCFYWMVVVVAPCFVVQPSFAITSLGKRESIALLCLPSDVM